MTGEALTRDYRAALLRHLAQQEEATRTAGYDLGRGALEAGVGLLELVTVHHEVLAGVLRDSPPQEVPAVAAAAAGLLVEVLASYDMVQRGLPRAT